MKKIFLVIILVVVVTALTWLSWYKFHNDQEISQAEKITEALAKVTLALDWTPNTNHTGIYVAQQKGWYKNEGLNLEILPNSDVSPSLLINAGKADIGIGATEGILSNAVNGSPIVSIAAILYHNTSAMVVLADSGIKSPKDLVGKIYGGWGANYETPIINTMIEKDGGIAQFKTVYLSGDPITALETRQIDFAWIFPAWEMFEAKLDGFEVNIFPLSDYGIPDYYTPNFISSKETIKNKTEILKKFMKATAKGYEFASEHPQKSADILINSVPPETFPNKQLVYDSQAYISPHYIAQDGNWGWQKEEKWHDYPQFMLDTESLVDSNGQPVKSINFEDLYTNELLPTYEND